MQFIAQSLKAQNAAKGLMIAGLNDVASLTASKPLTSAVEVANTATNVLTGLLAATNKVYSTSYLSYL